jgi:uncharacterized protein with PIN domain
MKELLYSGEKTEDLRGKCAPVRRVAEEFEMKRVPPRCPYCKSRLEKVGEDAHSTYVFDNVSATYKFDDGESEPYCPNCDAELFDVFPDGVCNYRKSR